MNLTLKKQFAPVLARLSDDLDNPFAFEDMVDTINRNLKLAATIEVDRDIEAQLDPASTKLLIGVERPDVSDRLRHLVNDFPNPTLLLGFGGRVLHMNEAAYSRVSIMPGDPIDRLNLLPISGRALSEVLDDPSDENEIRLVPVAKSGGDRPISLAVMRLHSRDRAKASCLSSNRSGTAALKVWLPTNLGLHLPKSVCCRTC